MLTVAVWPHATSCTATGALHARGLSSVRAASQQGTVSRWPQRGMATSVGAEQRTVRDVRLGGGRCGGRMGVRGDSSKVRGRRGLSSSHTATLHPQLRPRRQQAIRCALASASQRQADPPTASGPTAPHLVHGTSRCVCPHASCTAGSVTGQGPQGWPHRRSQGWPQGACRRSQGAVQEARSWWGSSVWQRLEGGGQGKRGEDKGLGTRG